MLVFQSQTMTFNILGLRGDESFPVRTTVYQQHSHLKIVSVQLCWSERTSGFIPAMQGHYTALTSQKVLSHMNA